MCAHPALNAFQKNTDQPDQIGLESALLDKTARNYEQGGARPKVHKHSHEHEVQIQTGPQSCHDPKVHSQNNPSKKALYPDENDAHQGKKRLIYARISYCV